MINEQDVKYVASLSRIHLKKEEIHHLTSDLEKILGHIDHLKKLDVTGVQPTSHVLPLHNVTRKDVVCESFSQAKALEISIKKHNGAFQVPKVIE